MNIKLTELNKIKTKVSILKTGLEESIKKENNLNNQQFKAKIHLKRAEKLIIGLREEAESWDSISKDLIVEEKNTKGNIFITAACIAYLGPFFQNYR